MLTREQEPTPIFLALVVLAWIFYVMNIVLVDKGLVEFMESSFNLFRIFIKCFIGANHRYCYQISLILFYFICDGNLMRSVQSNFFSSHELFCTLNSHFIGHSLIFLFVQSEIDSLGSPPAHQKLFNDEKTRDTHPV